MKPRDEDHELMAQNQWHLVATMAASFSRQTPESRSREYGDEDVVCVLGGKASCRRKFMVHLQLRDVKGKAVSLAGDGVFISASVVFAHDHSPVVRSSSPASPCTEPPLFITFNGVEYPAHAHSTSLDSSGFASFKLSISLLSSKFDNRLFSVCFTPQIHKKASIASRTVLSSLLPCFSPPIRSISRKRNPLSPSLSQWPPSKTMTRILQAWANGPTENGSGERVKLPDNICRSEVDVCTISLLDNGNVKVDNPALQSLAESIVSSSEKPSCDSNSAYTDTSSCSDESIDHDEGNLPPQMRQLEKVWLGSSQSPFPNRCSSVIRPIPRKGVCRIPSLYSGLAIHFCNQADQKRSDDRDLRNNGKLQRTCLVDSSANCMRRTLYSRVFDRSISGHDREHINSNGAYQKDDERCQVTDEERAILYLELSLAEMHREIQRRKQELLRRKRLRLAESMQKYQ
ncbi:hypothetical protein KP509_20G018900 [Ceratopteris richardii]|uniref:Uncharacterized protein n=1 Tax=Ceratopteris richardii TaxID=49495 RepID=A0A8T2SGL8_CERRI|nr:hypothetical protein KP509_20G018900 [Ceratopteris richardii]